MAVYTINVKRRPRAKRTVTRRRLIGNARHAAKAAKKYLQQALNFDARTVAKSADVASASLIFRGDIGIMAKAGDILEALDAALNDTLKISINR